MHMHSPTHAARTSDNELLSPSLQEGGAAPARGMLRGIVFTDILNGKPIKSDQIRGALCIRGWTRMENGLGWHGGTGLDRLMGNLVGAVLPCS